MSLTFEAMLFARATHASQRRKYTNAPYVDHLAEVAGIVAAADRRREAVAIAWLHDCVEDHGVTERELSVRFGSCVARGVMLLSDIEDGDRETRKRLSRQRLAMAPHWIQTIKCADIISNAGSIEQFDPDFAKTYLKEKRLLLDAMKLANRRVWSIADGIVRNGGGNR